MNQGMSMQLEDTLISLHTSASLHRVAMHHDHHHSRIDGYTGEGVHNSPMHYVGQC